MKQTISPGSHRWLLSAQWFLAGAVIALLAYVVAQLQEFNVSPLMEQCTKREETKARRDAIALAARADVLAKQWEIRQYAPPAATQYPHLKSEMLRAVAVGFLDGLASALQDVQINSSGLVLRTPTPESLSSEATLDALAQQCKAAGDFSLSCRALRKRAANKALAEAMILGVQGERP